jgi:hypothetical protein
MRFVRSSILSIFVVLAQWRSNDAEASTNLPIAASANSPTANVSDIVAWTVNESILSQEEVNLAARVPSQMLVRGWFRWEEACDYLKDAPLLAHVHPNGQLFGGFGWHDAKTQKMDGFWKPLSGYAVQWIAPALDEKLIVISTIRAADELNGNRAPDEAKLFVYDVIEQKIVRDIVPIAKRRTTGLITETAPGRLLGLTVDTTDSRRAGNGVLYGVDVASGEVLFRKTLPWCVSVDNYWPHWVDPSYEYLSLTRGPDGFIWNYLKDVLVRIDPKDATVHVVGKLDPVGSPTFVGNDLYLSGPEQLRRIRGIVPALKPSDQSK